MVFMGMGTLLFAAFSSSNTLTLQNYGISSGGTNTAGSATYKLNASSGEVDGTAASGVGNTAKTGSIETQQANLPLAPTLSNGGSTYYNKLNCIINKGGADASDYTYVIAVSIDNFVTTLYVQADGTLGITPIGQTYSTWGAGSGTNIIGLTPSTTYKAKVSAMQGQFTQSLYGAAATAATVSPALSFSLTPNTLNLGSLLPGNIVTSATISIGFATNGAAGGNVYLAGKNNGLNSATGSYTIPAATNDLASLSEGVGMQGLTASQSSGGPFSIASPYNVTGTNVGTYSTSFRPMFTTAAPIAGGTATASYKAKASVGTAVATDYQEVLTFIGSASF